MLSFSCPAIVLVQSSGCTLAVVANPCPPGILLLLLANPVFCFCLLVFAVLVSSCCPLVLVNAVFFSCPDGVLQLSSSHACKPCVLVDIPLPRLQPLLSSGCALEPCVTCGVPCWRTLSVARLANPASPFVLLVSSCCSLAALATCSCSPSNLLLGSLPGVAVRLGAFFSAVSACPSLVRCAAAGFVQALCGYRNITTNATTNTGTCEFKGSHQKYSAETAWGLCWHNLSS